MEVFSTQPSLAKPRSSNWSEEKKREVKDKNLEIAFRLLKGMPRSVVALGVAQGGLAWGTVFG